VTWKGSIVAPASQQSVSSTTNKKSKTYKNTHLTEASKHVAVGRLTAAVCPESVVSENLIAIVTISELFCLMFHDLNKCTNIIKNTGSSSNFNATLHFSVKRKAVNLSL
jgi:hypothetical protein